MPAARAISPALCWCDTALTQHGAFAGEREQPEPRTLGCPEWFSRGSGEVASSSRCPKSSHMCCHRGNGSARLSPCGQGHLRGCPEGQGGSWSQEKGMGGLVVLLAAGGFTGHRLESELSFQRDTRIPAPRGVVQAPQTRCVRPGSSSFPPGPGAFLLFLTDTSSFHRK